MNKLIYALPLCLLLFLIALDYHKSSATQELEMVNRPLPRFSFPETYTNSAPDNVISDKTLPQKTIIINLFGSWCPTCLIEHHNLIELSKKYNIEIYGIALRDTQKGVLRYLNKHGNPYKHVALDNSGLGEHIFQAHQTPQSYIVDKSGNIRYHHKGPINNSDIDRFILPAIKIIEGAPS